LLLSTTVIGGARADWWSKTKRDLPADSGGITIPLATDALGRYVASVGMVSFSIYPGLSWPGSLTHLSMVPRVISERRGPFKTSRLSFQHLLLILLLLV
jgi:hypothetical protein